MQRRLSHRVSHHAPLQRLDGPSPQSAAAISFISRQLRRNACAAAADEEVGVTKLPEPSRRVQLNVVANRLELPRIEGELDVAIAREHHGTDGGSRPRTPCCHVPANPFAKALVFLNLQFAAPRRRVGRGFSPSTRERTSRRSATTSVMKKNCRPKWLNASFTY